MTNINSTSLRKSLFNLLKSVVQYNEIVHVTTKDGDAVILSKEEYDGMIATLELSSNSKLKKKILKGRNEKYNNCLDIDEAVW